MRRSLLVLGLGVGLVGTVGGGPPAQASGDSPDVFGAVLPIAASAREDSLPQVAWNAQCPLATQFLTVWQGKPADLGALSVYGRYTDGNAAALDPNEYFLDGGVSGPSFTPNVAANIAAGAPQPGFIYVYDDQANGGDDIYANLIDCSGAPVGGDIIVTNDGAAVADTNPDVACGSTGCWVVWETFVAPNTRKVMAASISGAGVLGGSVTLSDASTTARAVSIANNPSNGCAADSFLAVWQDQSAGTWDIRARELDGVTTCAAIATPASGAGNQLAPDAAYGTVAGLYELAWQDGGNVFARATNPDGTAAGARVTISAAANQQADPAVAYDSALDRFLTVWEDQRNVAAGFDIWGQRTTGAGALTGANFRFPSTNANAMNPSVAFSAGSARFYVNWDVRLDNVLGVGFW
jgi:hypothetical protein